MKKRGQMELAIIKGLILALVVISGFFIYDTIQATTLSGKQIECKWDCSNIEWSSCVNGYMYRDISQCKVNIGQCWESEPKPVSKVKCLD